MNGKETPMPSGFWKADAIVSKIMKYPSFLGPLLLIVIAVVATVNVIVSKVSGSSIPSANDWIRHFMIPTVWLSLGNVAVNRGLIQVDFLSLHFPDVVNRIIQAASYLLGAFVTGFICVQQWGLMQTNLAVGKMSSTNALSFHIWPFNLLMVLGLALSTFAFLWCAARQFAPKRKGENKA